MGTQMETLVKESVLTFVSVKSRHDFAESFAFGPPRMGCRG